MKWLTALFAPKCKYCEKKVPLTPHKICLECLKICVTYVSAGYYEFHDFGRRKVWVEEKHHIWMPSRLIEKEIYVTKKDYNLLCWTRSDRLNTLLEESKAFEKMYRYYKIYNDIKPAVQES